MDDGDEPRSPTTRACANTRSCWGFVGGIAAASPVREFRIADANQDAAM